MTEKKKIWDANYQQNYTEAIDNENTIRTKWFMRNRDKLLDNLSNENNTDNEKKKLKQLREQPRQWTAKESPTKVLKKDKKNVPSLRKPDVISNYMQPVDPKILKILYEKGEGSHESRKNYLRERYKTKPEDKFHIADCTSWLYGWRLKDFPPVPSSKLGQSSIIKDTFFRKNGSSIQRDVDIARRPQAINAKNFNDILTY